MAALTGKNIKDSYSGLLKTTDNAAVSSTYKEITDGLGNGTGLYIKNNGTFKLSVLDGAVVASANLKAEFTAVQFINYASVITLDFGAYQSFLVSALTGNVDFTVSNVRPGFAKVVRLIGDGNPRVITFNIGKHDSESIVFDGELGKHYWYYIDCISVTELALKLRKEA